MGSLRENSQTIYIHTVHFQNKLIKFLKEKKKKERKLIDKRYIDNHL